MAITPQHEKAEPTEADLEHAYNKARAIGLFLVEKYARARLRKHPSLEYFEVDGAGLTSFVRPDGRDVYFECSNDLESLLDRWDDKLDLTREPMRFTATGPVRREW